MGKPTTNTVDYFPHRIGDGRTLRVLMREFGNDGYACYFRMLEQLARAEGHFLDLSDSLDLEDAAVYCNVTTETFVAIMDILARRGRINPDLWARKILWCQKFVDELSDLYKRVRRRDPPEPPTTNNVTSLSDQSKGLATNNTGVSYKHCYEETPQSRVEESRVKNTPQPPIVSVRDDEVRKNGNNEVGEWWPKFLKAFGAEAEAKHEPARRQFVHTASAISAEKGIAFAEACEKLTKAAAQYRTYKAKSGEKSHRPMAWLQGQEYLTDWPAKTRAFRPGKQNQQTFHPND